MHQEVTVGRIVHYTLPAHYPRGGEVRPAIVVRSWSPIEHDNPHSGMVNLKVFLDGANDQDISQGGHDLWVGSVYFDPDGKPGTWRWPPRA